MVSVRQARQELPFQLHANKLRLREVKLAALGHTAVQPQMVGQAHALFMLSHQLLDLRAAAGPFLVTFLYLQAFIFAFQRRLWAEPRCRDESIRLLPAPG